MHFSRMFARWFPTPQLLLPRSAGIDITDESIKWVTLRERNGKVRVASFGQEALPEGIIQKGIVKDAKALGGALTDVKKHLAGAQCAHIALPEEGAYVFSMHTPDNMTHKEMMSTIEFELEGRVPIPVPEAVYDFDTIIEHDEGNGREVSVVAFPREIAEGYVEAFSHSGLNLLSMELEARSIARTVSNPAGTDPITLLIDSGKSRTGFAILKRGIPIFTSTVEVGGGHMTQVLVDMLALSEEGAVEFKNEQGLVAKDPAHAKGVEALEKIAAVLGDEVAKHYHFWDTRRNEHGERLTPVEQVLLVGGSANLKGLADYIAGKVHARTERPDVWRNVCSFDDYIPPIDRRTSLQYATAIGLSLRSVLV